MKHEFWHERWQQNRIGFHQAEVHDMLPRFIERLSLDQGDTVFLPLCGKTRDIAWLLEQGFRVVGSELSALAVAQLFDELDLEPTVTPGDNVVRYEAGNLVVFAGDIFSLSAHELGAVNGVYDRAALVALPAEMRCDYARKTRELSRGAPQLLVAFDYDQSVMPGPPFSVPSAEIFSLYGDTHELVLLTSEAVSGKLKGKVEAMEQLWFLSPRSHDLHTV